MNNDEIKAREDSLNEQIESLEKKIARRQVDIEAMQKLNEKDKNKLEQLVLFANDVENNCHFELMNPNSQAKSKGKNKAYATLDTLNTPG